MNRTLRDWAEEVRHRLQEAYPHAETMSPLCDNLDTHAIGGLSYTFDAETAGNPRRRLRLVFTPGNGSWRSWN